MGKTTLLGELSRRGFRTMAEAAREVIRERISRGLPPRPEPALFATQILERDIRSYRAADDRAQPVFFDRSVVEALAMLAEAAPLPEAERDDMLARFAYHRNVFVLPPWRAIYANDAERDQSFEEAERVDARVRACYRDAGYVLVEVPRAPVAERAAFVLRTLGFADA